VIQKELKKVITDKEYEIAAGNGISRQVVSNRVYSHKWDIERAITQPMETRIRDWEREIYALYKDDELVADGTIFEIAEQLSVTVKTVKFYQYGAAKARNKSGKRRELVYLGMDDDEE